MVKIEPAGHRVLIKCYEVEEKTAGGIIMPKNLVEDENRNQDVGTIVAIGPTAFEGGLGGQEAWGIEVGDEVIFMRHGGKLVDYPGYDKSEGVMRIVNDEDIVGILRRSAA